MKYNLASMEDRIRLIDSIHSENNKARKQVSLRSSEVNGGRIQEFVKDYLLGQLKRDSVKEMPLVTTINSQSAVVNKKATVYKKSPERMFTEMEDHSTVELIYKDMKLDQKLNTANKNYIYQDQTIGMIIPKSGKLICRILKMHQIDAIPSLTDPELSDGFIISTFDRTLYIQTDQDIDTRDTATGQRPRSLRSGASQDTDEAVAEKYQYQKYVEQYVVWTKEYNFMMNGLGEVIDPETGKEAVGDFDITSPLASEGIMPFFEVARDKDYEFFVRSSNNLTEFTIQFNAMLSDLATNMKMNGYAVAILKAPSELQPETQVIGPSMLLKLPTDDPEKEVDFAFASPSSNIGEIKDSIDSILNYFITSEGLGGNVVNSKGETDKATSGVDRFLQMISKLEAHSDDYNAFRDAESQIYKIIKAWLNVATGTDLLDSKYMVNIPEDSDVIVNYHKPEMIQTETEMIKNIKEKVDLRVMSRKMAIKELYSIDDNEKAEELLKEIDKDEKLVMPEFTPPSEIVEDELGREDEDEELDG